MITDEDGDAYQYLGYMPFGEVLYDIRVGDEGATPHQFTGKEKDEETGLNYFINRYYDPELGIFISVDPLIDKKPWISGYAYCLNNPLRYIDPDGRDEWEINKQGKILKYTKTKEYDKFTIVDAKGKPLKDKDRNEISKTFEYGTVKGQYSYSRKDNKGNSLNIDIYTISGDKQGEQLHMFFSNNTNIEWGNTKIKGGLNVLSTSHETNREYGSHDIRKILYPIPIKVEGHDHNHPANSFIPSPGDRRFSNELNNRYPGAETRIYTKKQDCIIITIKKVIWDRLWNLLL